MQASDVVFGVASITFTICLALPIGLFTFNPEIKQDFRDVLLWLYIPPIVSGIAAVVSGLLSIITSIINNWFNLGIFVTDVLAILAILIIALSLPYGVIKYNRVIVERAAEKIYAETKNKEEPS